MKSITQDEINATYPEMIKLLDDEIARVKLWANNSGLHVATAPYTIIRKYRRELKELRNTLRENIE